MRKAMWVDASRGAAGDMLMAALVDAGAPIAPIQEGLRSLAVEPIGVVVEETRRGGLRAMKIHIEAPHSAEERGLARIRFILDGASLSDDARRFANDVFTALAGAESEVHGVGVDEIHFHEVGALDSIADVVGCAIALESLGLLPTGEDGPVGEGSSVIVSAVGLGFGETSATHGWLPVPGPAVLSLLTTAGAPVQAGRRPGEACTPTGAALLTTLADRWGGVPPMIPRSYGVGAGSADPREVANVLRVVIGEHVDSGRSEAAGEERLAVVEATVDDLDPRVWPYVLDALHDAGAHDAWISSVVMRKGRPGYVVSALGPPDLTDAIFGAMVTHATTLGARVHHVMRQALVRDSITVDVHGIRGAVKRGFFGGVPVTAQPELADAVRISDELGIPVRAAIEAMRVAASSSQRC